MNLTYQPINAGLKGKIDPLYQSKEVHNNHPSYQSEFVDPSLGPFPRRLCQP